MSAHNSDGRAKHAKRPKGWTVVNDQGEVEVTVTFLLLLWKNCLAW